MVTQSPVKRNVLTPILGLLGSPHNLNEMAFDIESNNGSVSQVDCIEDSQICDLHSQPQISLSIIGHPQDVQTFDEDEHPQELHP